MGDDTKKEKENIDVKPAAGASSSQAKALRPNEQNIVIALDGSEQSIQAVNWYMEKVHRAGNRMVFVHVIELPEPKLNEAKAKMNEATSRTLHMSPGVLATMWKEEECRVKELEQKMKTILKEKGIKGVLRTASGKPGEIICRIAEEENAAMIVVGTRGMGRIRKTILGSVSDYMVNHAHCPVIVCRTRSRKPSGSGEGGRTRHFSGESIKKLFSRGKSRSTSVSSEADADAGLDTSKQPLKEEEEKEA